MFTFTVLFLDEDSNIVAEESRKGADIYAVEEWAADNLDEFCAVTFIIG